MQTRSISLPGSIYVRPACRAGLVDVPSGRRDVPEKRRQVMSLAIAILIWICAANLPCFEAACLGQSTNVTLQAATGETVQGTVTAIELDSIKLQTDKQAVELSFEKVDSIETGNQTVAPKKSPTLIELVDGSVFNGDSYSISNRSLTSRLHCGLEISLETRNIEAMRLRTYEDNLELIKQYREIKSDDSREGDAIVLKRDGELTSVEGIAGDFDDGKLEFSIGERTARVAAQKIDTLLFYHAAGRELASPNCELLLIDESRAVARRLKWKDESLIATLVCGEEMTIPLKSISRMNFSLGRAEFLSQMEPTTNDWSALITSAAIVEKLRRMKLARVNESFKGLPLSLKFRPNEDLSFATQIKQFEQGYAMQGGGKLAFSLGGRYRKLTGLVGFDPAASVTGHVKLIVLVDGKAVVEQELIHRTIKNPLQLDIDIKDAKRVVFQVDFQDGRSVGDQLHLVNLKVSQ